MTTQPPLLDIDELLHDRSVSTIVCCGSGGVGKTTTAAAIAIRAAEQGRTVAVLTIDPAKRLAQALGLAHLDNEPAPVEAIDDSAGGSLDAMMLDMKRTFDELVLRHSAPDKAQQILENPFYQAVSSSFAGTQEYMAMERLGQLHAEQAGDDARWDLIVVDTPPSRSALDFLDAPKRLGSFLDGKFIRLLMSPAKAGGRAYLKVMSVGVNTMTAVMSKVLGGQLLRDAQTFVAALDSMFGGFRERADQTYALLSDAATAFVVVATPERDALREASFFAGRLASERMPLAGLVVNRVEHTHVPSLREGRAEAAADEADELDTRAGSGWQPADTAALLRLHSERAAQAGRQEAAIGRFTAAHPTIPQVVVAASAQDVNDVEQLRDIGAQLAD
ncbi:anion-transporting ATPase [Flexivirga endophytica]|uniref:Anion-transporting ATPase n=1 Tax=Flexivirga endophytica TaxID=1849103 RepID=A0A916WSQ8_9MICO|nr:ArsA-related P-loop ATPase [Flexivirga endophytica]GGB26386.1 anion-transporting ATPase [Flexivirga endophytica]GHB54907.1 anion-transporting ATPase [Flexivirga endophytica]